MRSAVSICTCSLVVALLHAQPPKREDPFAAGVRPTDALSPQDEEKSFHLPPGFQIQLFASEPQIQKPINMAFDARGRLWVSCTEEYPYAAPPNRPAKDSIRVLEDTDGDGRADKVTVFAEGLNIPIGLYPYKNGVIAFSIPNISYYEDTDGDGKCDRTTLLYGPFDYRRDTHGLNNAFRRGFDGWVYANHGFNNHSVVQGKDGNKVDMQSGNTYRFRVDGSRIEQFTWGQVNPFGSTFDPYGDLFTADCHTKPIMLLLRRGYYDSFGKPHNGLGYVPGVMEHEHGSTAIAGTTQYTGSNFPRRFLNNMFVGNVMTSRINRDSLRYYGSTVRAVEAPDFISTDDPWFRPVDMQIGPDGALYIADFYNKIIGHYEVPLTHPGRDRHRGRIWKVTYLGTPRGPAPRDPSPDLRAAGTDALIENFGHANLGMRMRATDEITDRIGAPAVPTLTKALAHNEAIVRVQAGWALHRLGSLDAAELMALASDSDFLVRCHAMRMAAETAPTSDALNAIALRGLADAEPRVRRAAADAVSQHPRYENIAVLLRVLRSVPGEDVHLRHAVRLALLESAKVNGLLQRFGAEKHDAADADAMAGVALAIPSEEAANYLIQYLKQFRPTTELASRILTHAARFASPGAAASELASLAQTHAAADVDLQLQLIQAVRLGLQQRGLADPASIRDWGRTLTGRLLESQYGSASMWTGRTLNGRPGPLWRLEPRRCADGISAIFLSSLPLGERYTGILRSHEFAIPTKLRFYVCGHLGEPSKPAIERSFVRLRLEGTDEIIAKASPPRNDTAQLVEWDLQPHAGRRGYIEVVDGMNAPAYAWLAVARFTPAVVSVPEVSPEISMRRRSAAAELAGALALRELAPRLKTVATSDDESTAVRLAAARTLNGFHPNSAGAALLELTLDDAVSTALRSAIFAAAAEEQSAAAQKLLPDAAKAIPYRLQVRLAEKLAENAASANQLMELIQKGDVSARILRESAVATKLQATRLPDIGKRIEELTKALPPVEREIQQLLDVRRAGFARAKSSATRGQALFVKHCQTCHQIGGQGTVIGPQLDGIGERGLERIVEDVLDPNRNVDPAFVTTVYVLKDGKILNGLFRRQEGKTIVMADNTGKEISIMEDQVEEQRKSPSSLMPSNVNTIMTEPEFYDLLAYLLGQRGKREKAK